MAKAEKMDFKVLSSTKCKGFKGSCHKRIKQGLLLIKTKKVEFCYNCFEREVLGKTIPRKERKHINRLRRISA